MRNKYNILFKTGDAEIRALEKSNFDVSNIFPIVELTRGRKSKSDKVGLISKRIKKLGEIFSNQSICLDLTTSDQLSNEEIEELYSYDSGYENWVGFLNSINAAKTFKEIVPTILVDTTDENIDNNLKAQVESLSKSFKRIAYRNDITDDGYIEDIEIFAETIKDNNVEFVFIADCEYVPSGATRNTASLVSARITKVKKLIPNSTFIVISTSFPRYVSDIGNDNYDIFPLYEIDVHKEVKEIHNDVIYGDYGSINPIRNDTVVMARGWIPRIDVPTPSGIYYYRVRNKIKDYAATYSIVANKIVEDDKFPSHMSSNWGIKQILICKNGSAPGASPNFWISVRMSIFIAMQLKRLKL